MKDTVHASERQLLRYFGSGGAALAVIQEVLKNAEIVRIATAYFEPSGYQCLRETLRGKEVRLLLGRGEGGSDRLEAVMKEFFDGLISGPLEERTRAMEEFRDAIRLGRFLVGLSESGTPGTTLGPRYLYQHGKLYIGDRKGAVVGSSNFTRPGLVTSREAGYAVTEKEDVDFFVDRFDELYRAAEPVAEEFLKRLDEWLKIYSPYEIYMRSLLELYGLPEEDRPGHLPELAGYQRPIVSRVLRTIEDYGGAMLIASTGLGKTVMAGHAVAYLAMENRVNSVIVLCPAGLRTMWHRMLRAAKVSSVEYSYYILSLDDWRRFRDIGDLERELRHADEKTLIIMDESHHLRNQFDGRELRLRHQRIKDVVGRRAKVLLMTATPYSRDISDVNAQLMLLPDTRAECSLFGDDAGSSWHVDQPGELSDTPSCVVLTAPSVVRNYSNTDHNGERYVLFSGDQKRYFPRTIHMKNVYYDNPCDDMILELFQSGLLMVKAPARDNGTMPLFGEDTLGRRDPLMEARFVQQFCSSVKEVDALLGKLQVAGGFEKVRFEMQEPLSKLAAEMRCRVAPFLEHTGVDILSPDTKIAAVMDILNRFPDEKIVIFCVYRETARYIRDTLRMMIPNRSVETTVDLDPDKIEQVIRRFAPVANSIQLGDDDDEPQMPDEPVDVLVATTSMSEGFNFQDAPVLINFDLPWTVLVLAQRMGRILRPWKEPRAIHVFTLIPSTMENGSIHHALNWKDRLRHRGKEFTSFAEIPVVVEKGTEFEMVQLSHSMKELGDVDLDLDEVFQFIENADHIRTTSFIDDMAVLDEAAIRVIMKLPPGIRSCRKGSFRERRLYILFDFRGRVYPAIFDESGTVTHDSEKMDEIMNIIRSPRGEEPVISAVGPDGLDLWVQRCRNAWAARRRIVPSDLSILCQMVLE